MNVIVGDKVIIQRYRRTGTKYYLAEVKEIVPGVQPDTRIAHLVTILNADTGKKYRRSEQVAVSQLVSLEEFIDGKRALVKELEAYL